MSSRRILRVTRAWYAAIGCDSPDAGIQVQPFWPISAQFEVVVVVLKTERLQFLQKVFQAVAVDRTDGNEITFDAELVGSQSKALVDRGASKATLLVRSSANAECWCPAGNGKWHPGSFQIETFSQVAAACSLAVALAPCI